MDETTTAAAVTGDIADETHFEDKVSYNQLFWPFTQAFKAPNVVRYNFESCTTETEI